MGRRRRFRLDQVAEALRQAGGIQLHACQILKCSRSSLQRYIGRWPKLRDVIEEVSEEMLDVAETHVRKGVLDGDKDHVWRFLRTKGKKRGWTERTEVVGKDDGPIEQKVTFDLSVLTDDELRAAHALHRKLVSGTALAGEQDRD